jgi:RHS repeat-associated protein
VLGDHLGSTSIVTDDSGAKVSEMRYKPWGEVRYSWKASASHSLSDYTFTGQYSYMDDPSTSGVTEGFDLMFYNARWYDPGLGRFAQADSIVPAGVQGYDRYAYVNNNPVNLTDPSGHCAVNGDNWCIDKKHLASNKSGKLDDVVTATPTRTPTIIPTKTVGPTTKPTFTSTGTSTSTTIPTGTITQTTTPTIMLTSTSTSTVIATTTSSATTTATPTATLTVTLTSTSTPTTTPTIIPTATLGTPNPTDTPEPTLGWPMNIIEIPVGPNNQLMEQAGPSKGCGCSATSYGNYGGAGGGGGFGGTAGFGIFESITNFR